MMFRNWTPNTEQFYYNGQKKKRAKPKSPIFQTHRRLAVWRSLVVDQQKQLHYVTLSGDPIPKPRCFAAAKQDKLYLESFGLTDSGPSSSLADCYHNMLPYCENWTDDPSNLYHWYMPSSIVRAYANLGVTELYSWQIEVLKRAIYSPPTSSSHNSNPNNGDYDSRDVSMSSFDITDNNTTVSNLSSTSVSDHEVLGALLNEINLVNYQREKIGNHTILGRSVIYAAPTSGGKSLVAEILMARAALFFGRRSLLVLPHVALCEEKIFHLRKTLGRTGLRIEAFHSSEGSAATWHPGIDIAVCTIEKANAILNRLLTELHEEMAIDVESTCKIMPGLKSIGVVVIDELHMVGDPHSKTVKDISKNLMDVAAFRGFLLELLLTKLRRCSTIMDTSFRHQNISIQVVGLSATLPNLQEVAEWVRGEISESTSRPLPLNLYFKTGCQVSDRIYAVQHGIQKMVMQTTSNGDALLVRELPSSQLHIVDPITMERKVVIDNDHMGFLTWECVQKRQQTLVFCATKEWCQKACQFLTKMLNLYKSGQIAFSNEGKDYSSANNNNLSSMIIIPSHRGKEFWKEHDINKRLDIIEALRQAAPDPLSACTILAESIVEGVAYHHAGMSVEERSVIEDAYRQGHILVLCATSTLAVGVNLPTYRVIFRSAQIGREQLDPARFRQMAGRAGRKGFDLKGEAYLLCSNDSEAIRALKLLLSPTQPVESALNQMRLARLLLELVVLGLCRTIQELHYTVMEETLLATQLKSKSLEEQQKLKSEIQQDLQKGLQYLMSNAMLYVHYNQKQHSKESQPKQGNGMPHPLGSPPVLTQFFNTESEELTQSLSRQYVVPYYHYKLLIDPKNALMKMRPATMDRPTSPIISTADMHDDADVSIETSRVISEESTHIGISSTSINGSTDNDNLSAVLCATPLGVGIVESSMSLPEGVEAFGDLYRTYLQGLLLKSDLHLLFLITPLTQSVEPNWEQYLLLMQNLNPRTAAVARYFGITASFIRQQLLRSDPMIDCLVIHERWFNEKISSKNFLRFHQLQNHRRFYSALILSEIFNEAPINSIAERFKLRFGTIQALHNRSTLMAGVTAVLCDRLEWRELGAVFRRLGEKLEGSQHSGSPESELKQIQLVHGHRTVALIKAGFTTIVSVANASIDSMSKALEVLDRFEIPTGPETRYVLERQFRKRSELAHRIIINAKNVLNKQIQSLEDEAELAIRSSI